MICQWVHVLSKANFLAETLSITKQATQIEVCNHGLVKLAIIDIGFMELHGVGLGNKTFVDCQSMGYGILSHIYGFETYRIIVTPI